MNTLKDEQIESAIGERATEWFVRHRQSALTANEQRQFLLWLRASPRHVQAYLGLIALTAQLPQALSGLDLDVHALAQEIRQSPLEAQQAVFSTPPALKAGKALLPRKSLLTLAAAVLLTLGAGVYWGLAPSPWPHSIVVPAGQQRLLTLEDGSVAHLNSDTRLVLRYSPTQRLIELPEGQALFKVVHDARRPFIVRSGRSDVVAVGTQFDVLHRANRTQVTVVQGRVEIIAEAPARTVTPSASAALRLEAGERVSLSDEGRAARPQVANVAMATAWTRKQISFSADRLEEVAAQFNRFTGARIEIEDAKLRDYRISGVFQAYDVDSFLAYLQHFEGMTVERDGDDVRVRRKR